MSFGKFINLGVPIVALIFFGLMVFSAVFGDMGYQTHAALMSQHRAMAAEVDGLQDYRLRLENKVRLLKSSALDKDMVEERIRAILKYSEDGEIIIPRHQVDEILAARKALQ